MITIFGVALLFIIFGIIDRIASHETDFLQITGRILGCGFWGIIVGFILCALFPTNNVTHPGKTTEIVCLQDNSSIGGDFFLGCGNIGGAMMYTYYYKVDATSFKMNQLNYSEVTIKYCDSTSAPKVVEIIEEEKKNDTWNKYFALDVPEVIGYIIYVPEGTIKQNYSLDAQ